MKDLDRTKKYDLSQLNDEQLQAVLDWLKENDTGWEEVDLINFSYRVKDTYLIYPLDGWYWSVSKDDLTNAIELFDERLSNVKVDLKTPSDLTNKQREALISMFDEQPNYSCDKSDIYQRADQLMQDGKQHGLKIVVTFEKL